MARPTKLTDVARDRFVKALSAGAFPETAARFAGFSPASLYRYLRASRPEHAAFRDEVVRVQSELEVRLGGTVAQAAFSDPRWALTLLERRFPERWGRGGSVGDDALEAAGRRQRAADTLVTLDPSLVEVLVPRLLEAGQNVRGKPTATPPSLDGFKSRRPRRAGPDGGDSGR